MPNKCLSEKLFTMNFTPSDDDNDYPFVNIVPNIDGNLKDDDVVDCDGYDIAPMVIDMNNNEAEEREIMLKECEECTFGDNKVLFYGNEKDIFNYIKISDQDAEKVSCKDFLKTKLGDEDVSNFKCFVRYEMENKEDADEVENGDKENEDEEEDEEDNDE